MGGMVVGMGFRRGRWVIYQGKLEQMNGGGVGIEPKTRGNIGREEGKTERKDGANIAGSRGRYVGENRASFLFPGR